MARIYPAPNKAEQLVVHSLYQQPTKVCDIVMKGGVTSGIVYPLAICELAKTYTFKNIGGTSAGAIAAAATAAAELGRRNPAGGFGRVAQLPDELGKHDTLFQLFQPQAGTSRLFRLFTAPLGHKRGRLARIIIAALINFPIATLVGAMPGLLLALAVVNLSTWRLVIGLFCAVLLLLVGTTIGVVFAAARLAFQGIPANLYGLCSGLWGGRRGTTRPLTIWLNDLLNELAGVAGRKKPLTFEDLWGTRDPDKERNINLEVVTTCLTLGRPFRIPFDTKSLFFFHPDEFCQLFPKEVVQWMKDHPRHLEDPERFLPLVPLPEAADLPVIVATRMSLSFPLLISAVPLYAIDSGRKLRQDRIPEPCWFSDGGITSNLPVHFFDAPLPQWPTFTINLRPFHMDYCRSGQECENSYLPTSNQGGRLAWWSRLDQGPCQPPPRRLPAWLKQLRQWIWPSRAYLVRFIHSILDTMQNWRDNMQLVQPGYRDRVVHISLEPSEGGTNLRMDEKKTRTLSERGRCAGVKLRDRFAGIDPAVPTEAWDNHRWVRYRSTMSVLEEMLRDFETAYREPQPGERPYPELIARSRTLPPSSYRWERAAQREYAANATRALIELVGDWNKQSQHFTEGAPQPDPELRITPRM